MSEASRNVEIVALQLEQQFAAANGFPLVGSNAMKQLAVTNMKKLGVVPAVRQRHGPHTLTVFQGASALRRFCIPSVPAFR